MIFTDTYTDLQIGVLTNLRFSDHVDCTDLSTITYQMPHLPTIIAAASFTSLCPGCLLSDLARLSNSFSGGPRCLCPVAYPDRVLLTV